MYLFWYLSGIRGHLKGSNPFSYCDLRCVPNLNSLVGKNERVSNPIYCFKYRSQEWWINWPAIFTFYWLDNLNVRSVFSVLIDFTLSTNTASFQDSLRRTTVSKWWIRYSFTYETSSTWSNRSHSDVTTAKGIQLYRSTSIYRNNSKNIQWRRIKWLLISLWIAVNRAKLLFESKILLNCSKNKVNRLHSFFSVEYNFIQGNYLIWKQSLV